MTDDEALRAALAVELPADDQARFSAEVLTRRGRRRRMLGAAEAVVWGLALAVCAAVAAPVIPVQAVSPATLAGLVLAAAGLWVSLRLDRPAL